MESPSSSADHNIESDTADTMSILPEDHPAPYRGPSGDSESDSDTESHDWLNPGAENSPLFDGEPPTPEPPSDSSSSDRDNRGSEDYP